MRALVTLALALGGWSVACGVPEPGLATPTAPFVAALRPDNPSSTDLFRFAPGDLIEHHDSAGGAFRVHFTRAGVNAVPAVDGEPNGTPDFVEQVAAVYDQVLAFYRDTLGFRAPLGDEAISDNGGDGRFDVYLLDFAGMGDGAFRLDGCLTAAPQRCVGYMVQENDFAGYGYPSTLVANRVLGSHEFFHAVQAAYDVEQGGAMSEGTATWASEQFDPTLSDFEHAIGDFLAVPDRPLDRADDYGAALLFQFFAERFTPGFVRALWEGCEDGADGVADPYWLATLPARLAEVGTDVEATICSFAEWNLHTGSRADPTRFYAAGAGYPPVEVESMALPYRESARRVFYASTHYLSAPPGGRATVSAALVPPVGTTTPALRLGLTVERGTVVDPILWLADPYAGGETVSAADADRVILVLVSTALAGPSLLPGVCVGTPDEVRDCQAALAPPPSPPAAKPSGGCAAAGSAPWLVLLLLRRRRTRASVVPAEQQPALRRA